VGQTSNDLALLRLLLGGIGDNDPACRFCFFFNAFDDDAVVQRTEFHWNLPVFFDFSTVRRIGASQKPGETTCAWVAFSTPALRVLEPLFARRQAACRQR
jgi:hypothetical protein